MPVPPGSDEPLGNLVGQPREDGLDWHADIKEWANSDGVLVCGAKRDGVNVERRATMGDQYIPMRCAATGKMPNGRCRIHGGTAAAGPLHVLYQGKGHSKYIPRGLKERFEEYQEDPETSRMRFESSLLHARTTELLETLPGRTSAELWQQCQTLMVEMIEAQHDGDAPALLNTMNALQRLIQTGATASDTWAEIRDTIDARRKVQSMENRRAAQEQHTITHDQALMLMHGVVHVCNDVLDKYRIEPIVRDEIADGIHRLISARDIESRTVKANTG